MKKAKATTRAQKPKEEKEDEITNPLYGLSMEEAIGKIVKAGNPKKNKKEGK